MHHFFRLVISCLIFTQFSCQPNVQKIVDEAIQTHGGDTYEDLSVSFDFREKQYLLEKKGGLYRYERMQTDSSGNTVVDKITDGIFKREINGVVVEMPDSTADAYASSVNSVAYFFLLPAPLNDAAARKKLLGDVVVKGHPYHLVEVTFSEEGGGEDFQDRFLYWFHKDKKTLDYLAYSYETNGGGVRFREAYNVQTQNGLRFCDYRNYGFENTKTPLENLPELFEAGKLPLLSSIENKKVMVKVR